MDASVQIQAHGLRIQAHHLRFATVDLAGRPADIRARLLALLPERCVMPTVPSSHPEPAAATAARTIALQMLEERGRGAVLVGVARVDAALERLLQAVMNPDPGREDRLFRPEAPLGSFGAKVALARRLGLIDPLVERALDTLRRLRNAFAHSSASASLADSAHVGRLAQAYAAARANPLWSPLATVLDRQLASGAPPLDPALRDYILLITILVAFLEAAAQRLTPQAPAVVMGFRGLEPPPPHPSTLE